MPYLNMKVNFLQTCLRHGITDIFRDGPVEQEGILQHGGDVPPQVFQRHIAQIMPVDQNPAAVRLIEPGNQLGKRCFADACRPHQGQHLSGRAVEGISDE